jgi:hypothetical protein
MDDFTMYLDEQSQVIRQRVECVLDDEVSRRLFNKTAELAAKLKDPRKIRILAVSDTFGKPTPAARRSLMNNVKRSELYKLAMVGNNPFMRAVISFFLSVGSTGKVRLFENEDDALEWLKK